MRCLFHSYSFLVPSFSLNIVSKLSFLSVFFWLLHSCLVFSWLFLYCSMFLEMEEDMNIMNQQLKDEDFTEMVKWDKLLPQVVLRVLLVEADDSTRQIIAALLRKCSYRGIHL